MSICPGLVGTAQPNTRLLRTIELMDSLSRVDLPLTKEILHTRVLIGTQVPFTVSQLYDSLLKWYIERRCSRRRVNCGPERIHVLDTITCH